MLNFLGKSYWFYKYIKTSLCVHLYQSVTCIKRSPFSYSVISNFIEVNLTCLKTPHFPCPKCDLLLQVWLCTFYWNFLLITNSLSLCIPPPRGCAGDRIGTRFLRPRGTSPLKGANPAVTPGYRNGTESFFGLKGHPSVVRDV